MASECLFIFTSKRFERKGRYGYAGGEAGKTAILDKYNQTITDEEDRMYVLFEQKCHSYAAIMDRLEPHLHFFGETVVNFTEDGSVRYLYMTKINYFYLVSLFGTDFKSHK